MERKSSQLFMLLFQQVKPETSESVRSPPSLFSPSQGPLLYSSSSLVDSSFASPSWAHALISTVSHVAPEAQNKFIVECVLDGVVALLRCWRRRLSRHNAVIGTAVAVVPVLQLVMRGSHNSWQARRRQSWSLTPAEYAP